MKTTVMTNRNLFPALPSLIEDFFTRNWMDTASTQRLMSSTLPAVNIQETSDAFLIEVAAPGMKREQFNVQFENFVLTISAETKDEEPEKNESNPFTRREFNYASFERSFALPENKIDAEKIEAKYADGILHITVPKKEEAKIKPARQISIS
jgi:HSP20 family protein